MAIPTVIAIPLFHLCQQQFIVVEFTVEPFLTRLMLARFNKSASIIMPIVNKKNRRHRVIGVFYIDKSRFL